MAEVIITVRGVEQLIAKMGKLRGVGFMQAPMQRSMFRLQRYMARYPSPPPQSKYRRTGTLGRRWTTRVDQAGGNALIGKIGNNTVYAPLVQSSALQARVHRGRWQTDRDAIRDMRSTIVRDFEQSIEQALR
jgi:hypothetical protein